MALLAQAGVTVQADEAANAPLVPTTGQPILRMTRFQLQSMVGEAAVHGGILGSDIDAVAPMPNGAPPFSYLLAAWVTTATSPAGGSIRDLMGPQDWERAPTVVFPTIGIELFLAEAGNAARGPTATVSPPTIRTAAFTPCSAVSNFVQDALSTLFNALKLDPSQFGDDLPGQLFGFLAQIWNAAVQLAQAAVSAAIRELTRPVVDTIRTILATAAVISMLASYLKPLPVAVEPDPARTAFAIGSAPDVTGRFHARADISSIQWPPVLTDCAKSVGLTLPELAKAGSPVEWTVTGSAPGLVTTTSPTHVGLEDDRTSRITYITGRESEDQAARGQPIASIVWASATVERKEVTEIKAAIKGFVLGQLPNAVAGVVSPILGPIVDGLINRAASILDSIFKARGSGLVIVDHHKEPEPTPSPSATSTRPPTPRPTPSPTRPSPSPSSNSAPPCPDGCAHSNGDPHLRTIDGHFYDFQAAGEYVLLRSPDGSIEIQSRQEVPPEGHNITINTAVALRVNGHKVGVYVVASGLQLHVDGAVVTGTDVVDLGAGATAQAHLNGYQISLPDGSMVWLLSLGQWGINAMVKPSATLKTGDGLIGPVVPGGLDVPSLPDGTRLPRASGNHERFQEIYGQLGPAWRVTTATTLFDYDAGKDTDSYTIAGFPDEALLQSLSSLPPEQQAAGLKACQGVADPDLQEQCAFDFVMTQALAYVQLYGLQANFIATGPAALDQPPPPAPLPEGFFDIAPDLRSVAGGALGPTGILYLSLDLGPDRAEVIAVDPTNGNVLAHVDAQGIGGVGVAAGSVWVGEFAGSLDCSISRLDPATLAVQATIPTPCDITGTQFVVADDAVWFVDRLADPNAVTGKLRRIDPATGQPDAGVVIPFLNGFLISGGSSLFYGDTNNGFFRLRPGEAAVQPVGDKGDFGIFPVGDGYWTEKDQSAAVFFATPDVVDRTVPVDGQVVGADDQALYVDSSDPTDGTSVLMRYPIDGSPPVQIGRAGTVNDKGQQQSVGYFDNDPLFVGHDAIVKLWVVNKQTDPVSTELIGQRVPLP